MTEELKLGPDEAATEVTQRLGRRWIAITDQRKDVYADRCAFLLVPEATDDWRVLIIARPLPGDSNGPLWVVSCDSGDNFSNTGKTLADLLDQPNVIPYLKGDRSVSLVTWQEAPTPTPAMPTKKKPWVSFKLFWFRFEF